MMIFDCQRNGEKYCVKKSGLITSWALILFFFVSGRHSNYISFPITNSVIIKFSIRISICVRNVSVIVEGCF